MNYMITFIMGDESLDSLLETYFASDSSFDWAVGVAWIQEVNKIENGPFAWGAIFAYLGIDSSISFLDQDPLEDLLVRRRVDQSPMEGRPCCCCSLPASKKTNFRLLKRNGMHLGGSCML